MLALTGDGLDMRRPLTSKAELLRGRILCRQAIEAVNERVLARSYVVGVGLADTHEPITSSVRGKCENRTRIDITSEDATISGD